MRGNAMPVRRMKKLFLLVVFLLRSLLASAAEVPEDVTPFVRLGHLVKVSIYKNPIFDTVEEKIINRGELITENLVQMPVGSGTIVSSEGLILTNWHVYQISGQFQYNERNNVLQIVEKAGLEMLVYRLNDNDPLKVPVLEYLAFPLSLDEAHDTALLKIVKDINGNTVDKKDFSYIRLGNPFELKLSDDIMIMGYPLKGGDTMTVTEGKFLGYYRNRRFPGLDGFIKTNAAMAPGNSGGSALNQHRLIGIPTAVTLPTDAGSDLGYIHPVTWALKSFVIAQNKFGLKVPGIPLPWLKSEYNTDESAENIYVTGTLHSANSEGAVSARVVVMRADRSLEEIEKIYQAVQSISLSYLIQQMWGQGASVQEIAQQFRISQAEVDEILASPLSEQDIAPDVKGYLSGEFYYTLTQSDERGFFILSVPRENKLRVHIFKDGFRNLTKEITTGNGHVHSLGKIKLFQY